eukprot:1158886-Pelagomonas_calceolata.AAC.1
MLGQREGHELIAGKGEVLNFLPLHSAPVASRLLAGLRGVEPGVPGLQAGPGSRHEGPDGSQLFSLALHASHVGNEKRLSQGVVQWWSLSLGPGGMFTALLQEHVRN